MAPRLPLLPEALTERDRVESAATSGNKEGERTGECECNKGEGDRIKGVPKIPGKKEDQGLKDLTKVAEGLPKNLNLGQYPLGIVVRVEHTRFEGYYSQVFLSMPR